MEVRTLAGASVLDVNGRPSVLGEHWRRHPAVIVWLRHYGCIFCREQAAQMRAVAGDIERLGAELVFVGNGSPAQARDFQEKLAPGSLVLTDPDSTALEIAVRAWALQDPDVRAAQERVDKTRTKYLKKLCRGLNRPAAGPLPHLPALDE